MQKKKQWYVRTAPSLGGGFEGTPESAWGVKKYDPEKHNEEPTVFFGLYGLPDFYALWRHKGKKAILWAGTDILHFCNGYWLDEKGDICLESEALAEWIDKNCDNYVENDTEKLELLSMGIKAKVIPSFLGYVKKFPITYKDSPDGQYHLYTSVSGNDFAAYGWETVKQVAKEFPYITFHLFGNTIPFKIPKKLKNVKVHGRVSLKEMNDATKNMHGAYLPANFSGTSELLVKSILWGQHPVCHVKHPHVMQSLYEFLEAKKDKPNTKARNYYLKKLNSYPWNNKK